MIFAFVLTLLAGLATCLGGFLSFAMKRNNAVVLGLTLSFSAGAMLYVSAAEIVPKAFEILPAAGAWLHISLAVLAGLILIWLLDVIFEKVFAPKTQAKSDPPPDPRLQHLSEAQLLKVGWFTALILTAHNFPEGFATFLAGAQDADFAVSLAAAIGLHNIPEGVAVAAPIYFATGSKRQAMLLATISGLSEPVGALLGYLLLNTFVPHFEFAYLFAAVAGAMLYICVAELLPTACKMAKALPVLLSAGLGALIMAISLMLL